MPWDKISESEAKNISRAIENLKEQDFSAKSLKFWSSYYADTYDKFFITSRVSKIAVVYNTCSLSLKNRLLNLDAGKDARAESYSYLSLLQLITTVVHSPVSQNQAMLDIYKGINQTSAESVQSFLQKYRELGEDAWGPSSGWTMSQASLVMKKICDGFQSTELSRLATSIVVTIPFQWATICDSILQFQQRVKSTHPQQNVHAIQQKERKLPVCYKCGQEHYMRNCKTLVCRYCGQAHKHADCAKNSQRTYCVKCKSKFHNQEGHYRFSPDNQKPRRSDINMIKATSFLEGAVSKGIDCTGENFINTKLLINTGALIPSSVTISEQFFIDSLRGNVGQLVPSNFKLSKRG